MVAEAGEDSIVVFGTREGGRDVVIDALWGLACRVVLDEVLCPNGFAELVKWCTNCGIG